MIYQIISYDIERNLALVKVVENESEFEGASLLPISLSNLQSREELEKQIYLTYVHTLKVKERSFSLAVEMFVRSNVSMPLEFVLPIVPMGVAQSSTSDARTDDNTDPNAQVI